MKHELVKHLTPLFVLFIIISIFWFFGQVIWVNFLLLFFGLIIGAFFLDIDHLIYWLYTHPNLEESRLAKLTLKKMDFRSTLTLLESVHKKHTDLIFHHFMFQLVLIGLSIFLFTSTTGIFGLSFILAINIHLFVDEYDDYKHNPTHLQKWLFARLPKQLPQKYLKHYLALVALFIIIFTFLLVSLR